MTSADTLPRRFEMGRVVNRTFGAISRNFVVFGLISLLFAAVPNGLLEWVQLAAQRADRPSISAAEINLLSLPVTLLSTSLLQAALIHGAVADLNGRRAELGECLSTGLRYLLPVLAIGVLGGIAMTVGLIMLIVPGVFMIVAWMVTVPAEVVERRGVLGSFGRSADLTRYHRGSILGLLAAYLVLILVASFAIGIPTGLSQVVGGPAIVLAAAVLSGVLQALIAMVGAAGVASIYYELRAIKEGIVPETLASVFD